MDEIVKAALKKWPNVPHCYGWLALDARGDWYMRDDQVQAAGPFPQLKGSRIVHDKLIEFINRNYEADERGAWFFQNGPQRVYLQLEAAPWVLGVQRMGDAFQVETHTRLAVSEVRGVWLDESGRLFLETEQGLGVVRSMDMDAAASAVEAGAWVPQDIQFAELPRRFAYCLAPQPVDQA
ncbi:MAG: DUF2946 family protein [Rubrivivax sp.]|nr:MAG: DUF2946 family protein [Rubrivivax sp.]